MRGLDDRVPWCGDRASEESDRMRKGAWGRTIPDRSRRESHAEVLVRREERYSSPGESPVGRSGSLDAIAASSE